MGKVCITHLVVRRVRSIASGTYLNYRDLVGEWRTSGGVTHQSHTPNQPKSTHFVCLPPFQEPSLTWNTTGGFSPFYGYGREWGYTLYLCLRFATATFRHISSRRGGYKVLFWVLLNAAPQLEKVQNVARPSNTWNQVTANGCPGSEIASIFLGFHHELFQRSKSKLILGQEANRRLQSCELEAWNVKYIAEARLCIPPLHPSTTTHFSDGYHNSHTLFLKSFRLRFASSKCYRLADKVYLSGLKVRFYRVTRWWVVECQQGCYR